MTTVLHIISHFDLGGAERVAASIARSASPGYDYHIVEVIRGHSRFTEGFIGELRQAGITMHRSPFPEWQWHYVPQKMAAWMFPWWAARVVRAVKPDVVHCHTEMADWATYRLFHCCQKLMSGTAVVRTIHNTHLWAGMERTGSRVEAWLQQRQANVGISQSVCQCYADAFGQQPPIIYNGVAQPASSEAYDDLRAGKVNVLFAGRLEEQKGIDTLLDIIERRKADGRYFFHVVGDGRLRPLVEQRLASCPNAVLRPPVFGLANKLSSFSYLLMPSRHEGLSILSIEASMAGLPVIANACEGLVDTLPAGWPLLVEGNDMGQYDHIFDEVLPSLVRSEASQVARQFATEHFSVRQMQLAYEDVYAQRVGR